MLYRDPALCLVLGTLARNPCYPLGQKTQEQIYAREQAGKGG